jgi:hypothetical protein
MTSNHFGHLITSTIITLQHFVTLHHTSPNYTSLHLSTLYFLSFTLHYSPIWLNPPTFPIVLFHLTRYGSHIPKLISKVMNPFTALKDLSPFHFTSLCFAIHICNSLPFTSLAFTFYFLSPSLPPLFYTFLTLVLKIRVLPWEVPIAPSGSWFQSVMDLFTKEYFPV